MNISDVSDQEKWIAEELEPLITAHGNACFDCGEWDDDDDNAAIVPYSELNDKVEKARAALVDCVKARLQLLQNEVDDLRSYALVVKNWLANAPK